MLLPFVLTLASSAFAADDDYKSLLAEAKAALLSGDYRGARDLLTSAESAAAESPAPLSQTDIARLSFYRGVLFWRASPEASALENWRETLTVAPAFQPDTELLPDAQERDVFLALGAEVQARTQIPVKIPEDTDESVIFIDGQRMDPDAAVYPGAHLVQVKCEGGEVHGAWYTYGAAPANYLVLCSGGAFKGGKAASSASASSSSSSSASKSSKTTKEPKASGGDNGEVAKNVAGISLLGVGAAGGVVSVLLYDAASQARVAYDKKSTLGETVPEAKVEADDYYDHTLVPRYMRFYGASIGSGVLLATGTLLVILDVDGPMVTPLPGGGMLSWTGRF